MKKFCIIANRDKDEDLFLTNQIIDYLKENGCQVDIAQEAEDEFHYTDVNSIPLDTECVIVLGGDGTILHASHDLIYTSIPILGINLGTLGFLAEIEIQNVKSALANVIQGNYRIEERMMIGAKFQSEHHNIPVKDEYAALNDIVIARSGFSRIICVGIYVNGAWVQDYRGDGVIISTPTGSTGYNLSAGGPIITPMTEMMVITPICPHTLNARSIVVSDRDTVEVVIRESKKTQKEEAIATMDGERAVKLGANNRIIIRKSEFKARLLRFEEYCFFNLLRSKFGEDEYH